MFALNLSQIALLVATLLLFAMQLYYIWLYLRVARAPKSPLPSVELGISVVVIVEESFAFESRYLPLMLAQKHPNFEIIAVDMGSGEEFLYGLKALENRDPNFRVISLHRDNRYRMTTKMAYNVGIKAAKYDNIVLTTTATRPLGEGWLAAMAAGFAQGTVVLGYCAVERSRGLINRIVRTQRAMLSLRYFAAAMDGMPYRGVLQNIGFRKSEYFGVKGFNHLNMNIGEEDLFIQTIARGDNTVVMLDSSATTIQRVDAPGMPSWSAMRRRSCYTTGLYPTHVKRYLWLELISRALFLSMIVVGLVMLPLYCKIVVALLLLIRFIALSYVLRRFSKLVGDCGVTATLIINDIFSPINELWLLVYRKVISPKGLWN